VRRRQGPQAPATQFGVAPEQFWSAGVGQPPTPSQKAAGVTVLGPLQVAAAHCVVGSGYGAHAPPLAHRPDRPQVPAVAGQVECGSVPARANEHVPLDDAPRACEQVTQVPLHAVSQQNPSTQKPLAHCPPEVQMDPIASEPVGTQAFDALQKYPDAQSPSPPHGAVLHAPTPQAYGAQLPDAGVPHVPLPSQVAAGVMVEPVQLAAPQIVPAAQSAQAPEPLQVPVVPQVAAAVAAHSLSGSLPATIAPQTPSLPCPFFAAVQAWHVPLHAELQQTPSAQNPEAQSPFTTQALPCAQRVAQPAALPPQSTSVSVPFFVRLSQESVPPQPSAGAPHVAPTCAHVFRVQPHTLAVPPPPQVCGSGQSAFD
jgi:hypothetical protein